MFIALSKILPIIVYPLGLITILLVIGLVLGKRRKMQNVFTYLALSVIIITGNSWIAMTLVRSLEWQYLPLPYEYQADVIVVLGGGTEPEQYPRPMVQLNSAGNRIFYAAELYKEGKAPHILLSGGSIDWLDSRRSSTSAEEMAKILEILDVPKDAVWLQTRSQNTHEDALFCHEILAEKGINRIILVTSAIHMPRAAAIFKRQGFDVIPAPVDYSVTQAKWEDITQIKFPNILVDFFPNVGNMGMVSNAIKEYLGIFIYNFRGWL